MGDAAGSNFQGGAVDIITSSEVEGWKEAMQEVVGFLKHGGKK